MQVTRGNNAVATFNAYIASKVLQYQRADHQPDKALE